MIEKPDKIVAESIKIKLDEENLLKDTDSDKIVEKLLTGTITEEDWTLMAELSIANNEGDNDAKKD